MYLHLHEGRLHHKLEKVVVETLELDRQDNYLVGNHPQEDNLQEELLDIHQGEDIPHQEMVVVEDIQVDRHNMPDLDLYNDKFDNYSY